MKKNELLQSIYKYLDEQPKKEFVPRVSIVPVSGADISSNDIVSIIEVALSGWFTEHTWSGRFVNRLKNYVGTKYGLLCNSGSSANLLALSAVVEHLFVKQYFPERNKIVTCATGFPTTIAPIIQNGFIPLFVDADPRTLNPNIDTVLSALERDDVAGIILAHTLGFPYDAERISIATLGNTQIFIEDACLVAETKIKTLFGDKDIKDVKKGDFVLTRNGYKKVLVSRQTGIRNVITCLGIKATPNHPVITKDGIKRLDALRASDIIYIWNEKQSSIEERSIIDTQNLISDNEEFIIGDTLKESLIRFTDKFGLIILGKFLKDFVFIIKTIILSIMTHQTLKLCPNPNTRNYTTAKIQNSKREDWKVLNLRERPQRYGMEVKKEGRFIVELGNSLGKTVKRLQKFVRSVKTLIKRIFLPDQKIVLESVKTKVAIYNLLIESSHEFFANNVLVHNCDALGAEINGKKVGTFGDASTYSFFPAHAITSAEGGAVLTDSVEICEHIKGFRDWGRSCRCAPGQDNVCGKRFEQNFPNLPVGWDHKYTFDKVGYNLKITDLQSALGYSQMGRIDEFVEKRRYNYSVLDVGILPFIEHLELPKFGVHVNFSPFGFPITVTSSYFTKRELVNYLETHKIRTRPVFAGNITRHPMMDNVEYEIHGSLVGSDQIMDKTFWIGCHPQLTRPMLDYVIEIFDSFFKERGLR